MSQPGAPPALMTGYRKSVGRHTRLQQGGGCRLVLVRSRDRSQWFCGSVVWSALIFATHNCASIQRPQVGAAS